jgi:hypothetical protein
MGILAWAITGLLVTALVVIAREKIYSRRMLRKKVPYRLPLLDRLMGRRAAQHFTPTGGKWKMVYVYDPRIGFAIPAWEQQ